jgi:ABC-type arginine/histidine transport system permease subunit
MTIESGFPGYGNLSTFCLVVNSLCLGAFAAIFLSFVRIAQNAQVKTCVL